MSDIRAARKMLVDRILGGDGRASHAQRRAAFDNAERAEPLRTLVGKIATQPNAVTDDDVVAARTSGRSEDQIFELVVCAAVGAANRMADAAFAALQAAVERDGDAARDPR